MTLDWRGPIMGFSGSWFEALGSLETRKDGSMNEKSFLAAGDTLINPALLAYASVETDSDGIQVRLGFAGGPAGAASELKLQGLEARSVLRWLRTRAEFLDSGSLDRRVGASPLYRSGAASNSVCPGGSRLVGVGH